MTKYVLPALAYDYSALEPYVSGRIMELHHDKHHRTYVDDANEAIEQLMEARSAGDFDGIAALERKLAFNVSGHLLHSIFWRNMSPEGGGAPSGGLATDIERDFGSFDKFRKQMVNAAATTMGSGWPRWYSIRCRDVWARPRSTIINPRSRRQACRCS